MLFAADIGNSSITFGVFDRNGGLCFKSKVDAVKTKCADEYAVLFSGILNLYHFDVCRITGCILCSVVPPLTHAVSSAMQKLFGTVPLEVGPGIKTGLNMKIELQAQLGADLAANAVAATARFESPLVIVDMGTATTFTVINREGFLEGVIIAPGVRISMNALAQYASELPDISLAPPKRLIAKNTQESMRSGVLCGHAAMTDGLIERIRKDLNTDRLTVVATGGLAEIVLPYCEVPAEVCPDLTLTGLWMLYQKNKAGSHHLRGCLENDKMTK